MASPIKQTVKSCGKAHAYCGECRPDVVEAASIRMRQYYADHPEAREALSLRRYPVQSCGKAHAWCTVCRSDVALRIAMSHNTPEAREATSIQKRQYYAGHPERVAKSIAAMRMPEAQKRSLATRRTPEAREANSIRRRRYYADHNEAMEAISIRQRRYYSDHPDAKAALIARTHTPEVQAKSAATLRTPAMRQVNSYNRRRYYANDSETGGAEIPGKMRDMFIRTREAYKAAHAESES